MYKKICLSLLLLFAGVVGAQGRYPDRPITVVVPFAAGGDTDHFARALAHSLERIAPPPSLIIDNRAGNSGIPASLTVRQAPADGYTLLAGRVGTHAIQPAVNQDTPYTVRDFTTLAVLELDPMICAVRANSPHQSARDLLAAIRKQPGIYKYSTSGAGTILNFAALYLMSIAGVPTTAATGVHFNGGHEAVRALVDGQVDFICAVAATISSDLSNGTLRGLLTTAAGRMQAFPQIPNAREAGYRDMSNIMGWTALMGPPGLPAEVVRYWRQTLEKVAADPAWQAANLQLGSQPAIRLIARPEQYVQEQAAFYQQLALSMKIRP